MNFGRFYGHQRNSGILLILTSWTLCLAFRNELLQLVQAPAIMIKEKKAQALSKENLVSVCETTTIENNTSISAYLSQMEQPQDWLLLKWNPDGSFDHSRAQTKTIYQQWAPSAELLGSTEPSEFGRVVLLLNSDCVPMVPWTTQPPAPIWVYSMPTSTLDPRHMNISDEPIVGQQQCHLDRVAIIPTPYDTGTWNRFCVESVERNMTKRTFAEKINQVIWRGAIHSAQIEQSRVALLDYSRKISNSTSSMDNNNNDTNNDNNNNWLNVQEVERIDDPHHMEFYELADYRYHLDLGGLSGTSWGGLRWKLCSGLLVFKVESWSNDWWYDTLRPWIHYIPVRADVCDLHERYQWTQKYPEDAQAIAEAGRDQCLKSFGPEAAPEYLRAAVQSIPAADQTLVSEAEDILEELIRLDTNLAGLPFVAASRQSDRKYFN